MQHTLVNPPAIAAAVPVAMVSLCSPPGSRKEIDINILSKYRLETSLIPFNIHVFPPNKFDLLKVNLQIIEHFVYGVANLEGHKLMDKYKSETLSK